jgi:hypothetical protein
MNLGKATDYRERAKKCREAAELTSEEHSKDHWRSAESRWLKLANQTELLANLVGMGRPEEPPAPPPPRPGDPAPKPPDQPDTPPPIEPIRKPPQY